MKHFILPLLLLASIASDISFAVSFGGGVKSSPSRASSSSSRPSVSVSKPSPPASKPAAAAPKPVSFSGGTKTVEPAAAPKPVSKFSGGTAPAPKVEAPAAAPSYPSAKFSGGTGSAPSPVATPSPAAPASRFSSGTAPAAAASVPPPPTSPDAKAAEAQKRAESKAKFEARQRAKEPIPQPVASSYTKYDMGNKNYWQQRESRERVVYREYYSQPQPTVVYRDSYSPAFFFWMGTQSVDTRAAMLYNHRNDMDNARYQQQLAADAELAARVSRLEAEGAKRDVGYTPPGMDQDLMYDKKAVVALQEERKEEKTSPVKIALISFIVVGSALGAGWFIYKKVIA